MQRLANIITEIADLPACEALARSLAAGPRQCRVAPVPNAARVPLVAALSLHSRTPLLYVTINADAALRAADDLRQWLGSDAVLYYPASDAMPYEHMSPGDEVIAQRLRVLQLLATDLQPPMILVAPLKALLQPTLSRTELASASMTLQRDAVLNQERLLRTLVARGYRPTSAVTAPGEINRRGGIVDLWPSADERPLRIEFFGDEIESLRRFDPATQRSDQRLDAASISPPHEIPLWNREQALAWIESLDCTDLRRETQAEWEAALERLRAGERFEGRAFYAPFFRAPVGPASPTLLDHLPPECLVLLSEAHMLAHHAGELAQHAEAQRFKLVGQHELPAAFPRPYLNWDESGLDQVRAAYRLVDLSHNEDASALAPPVFGAADHFGGQFRRLISDIVTRLRTGERVVAVTAQAARLQELVSEELHGAATPAAFVAIHGMIEAGWRLPSANLTLYTDSEIFGIRQRRPLAERRRKSRHGEDRAAFLRGLKVGDYVVHIEHGIAIYDGLIRRTVGEIEREYLVLRYAAGDKIYVPVDQIDRVTRYIGAGDSSPTLTRLGTQDWERAKRKARAAVQDLAQDLLALYAQRQTKRGHAFNSDNEWQRELEGSFPYIETEDQLRVLAEVKHDMEHDVPMDRLICGDVGFGKTEVALRAAFKAVQDGKQVALLVPTTVLAQQHFETFKQRMAAFPVKVEMLSRFRSAKEQEVIMRELLLGRVDIIIGTHRLLSKDVIFKDLGLVIVDEEQRFGVRHKERLKQLRAEVDVLTLTATPIPRTLHMAMAGIRDLSVIDTPPEDRIPVKTYVTPYDETLIREAILRELERNGQVYFVHNRVQSIYHVANHLRNLVPEANIGVGHGQLNERELEQVMIDFFEGRHDVLVCTTIIESGLDVSSANTMIIDDATNFGLAQLYQLRGRVGRSANRAYAYLFYKGDRAMTEEAQQRLEAIQEATELGAGFRVAMRDLEIRGAGNLLGAEQSGHIAAVGFDLYSRLLEQAVQQLKQRVDAAQHPSATPPPPPAAPIINEKVLVSPLVTLDLPLTAYLPNDYIPDDALRLGVYQRMVGSEELSEVRALRQELQDRFGTPPLPALHLLTWLQIKALALQAGVTSVTTTNEEFIIRLPILDTEARERLRRRYGRDPNIKVGPQYIRLNRRGVGEQWSEKVMGVLEVLAAN